MSAASTASIERRQRALARELEDIRVRYVQAVAEIDERLQALALRLGEPFETAAIPAEWNLTRVERLVLATLAARPVCSAAALIEALYWKNDGPNDPKGVVNVKLCVLRRKLKPHGITIETTRGVGYSLSEAGRAALRGAAC